MFRIQPKLCVTCGENNSSEFRVPSSNSKFRNNRRAFHELETRNLEVGTWNFHLPALAFPRSMTHKSSRLKKLQADAQALWDESIFRSSGEPTKFYKFVHFWMLVVRSFVQNRCLVRASSLSFVTLLALIPMLAVAISVTSSLLKTEGEDKIYQFIDKFVSTMVPAGLVESEVAPAPTNQVSAIESTNASAAVSDL